jgi:hypothetical protein
MKKGANSRHEHYELMNLLGYGLAKFGNPFIRQFGYKTKTDFYQHFVKIGLCDTPAALKQRQDMLDPFFENGRSGWWQRQHQYISRKLFIDSLFGDEDAVEFAQTVKMYLAKDFDVPLQLVNVPPVRLSMFKRLQETGKEAELYFWHNYTMCEQFAKGSLVDARLLGDGYDFQIQVNDDYLLAEIKGVKLERGGIRMTKNEYDKARCFKENYFLVVVSNLVETPKMTLISDPLSKLELTEKKSSTVQLNFHTPNLQW